MSHDPLAEQQCKLLELLLQTRAKRNHIIKRAETARQAAHISQEPKWTDAEQIEKPRKRTPKSTGNDARDFVVGFTIATAAAATHDTAHERVANVSCNRTMTDIDFWMQMSYRNAPSPFPWKKRRMLMAPLYYQSSKYWFSIVKLNWCFCGGRAMTVAFACWGGKQGCILLILWRRDWYVVFIPKPELCHGLGWGDSALFTLLQLRWKQQFHVFLKMYVVGPMFLKMIW